MRKIFLVLLSFIFSLGFLRWAISAEPVTQKYTLENGLTVLITEMPTSLSVSVYALVKTGSATEGKYLGSGISHFVEHMLFKGTKKRPVSQIAQEVESLGGSINASTTFDYTMYTIELPQGNLQKAVDIIADMLMNSQFDTEQLEKERAVIFGEMRLYYDNPDRRLSQLVFSNAYVRHPYHHPIIGYEPLFAKITREDLLDYYHSTYIPNNMVLSIAGKIDSAQAFSQIKEIFKNFSPAAYRSRDLMPEPVQITPRRAEQEYQTDLTRLSMAYQGVSILDRDLIALDVLSMILGQGESSRLYWNVYKKKELVYSISASNFTPMDKGVFEIESLLEQKNVEATLRAIKEEIAQIQKEGVDHAELEKIKRQVLSEHLFANQTPGEIADRTAIDEAIVGDYNFSQKYLQAVNQVTGEDIKRVAGEYLVDNHLTIAIVKPKKEHKENSQATTEQKSAEIEKVTLDNGLVILLREDHSFPLVAMDAVFNGGSRQEKSSNNGISQLTADLWAKATNKRSAKEISQAVESRGMSLKGFSGRNSFGITMNLLSDDLNFGMDLLEELIKNPAFPDEEFPRAKGQQKAGIRARDDNISAVTAKTLRETLFLRHSFRLENLGTLESVEGITREDVLNFYKRFCAPNNMVLAVFGDFNKASVLSLLKKKFSDLKKKNITLEQEKEDPPIETREKTIHLDKEQALVMVGFQAPEISSPDRYGMEIIASLLGSSLNGRIFLKIRDQLGQAYTLGGGYTPGIDTGVASFFVSTTDENVQKVKDLLLQEIKALQINDVSDDELQNTKIYLKGSFLMGLETNAALGITSSLDELYGLGFDHYKSYAQAIDSVTKADIRRLALKYLDLPKSAVVLTRPTMKRDAAAKPRSQNSFPMPKNVGQIH